MDNSLYLDTVALGNAKSNLVEAATSLRQAYEDMEIPREPIFGDFTEGTHFWGAFTRAIDAEIDSMRTLKTDLEQTQNAVQQSATAINKTDTI